MHYMYAKTMFKTIASFIVALGFFAFGISFIFWGAPFLVVACSFMAFAFAGAVAVTLLLDTAQNAR